MVELIPGTSIPIHVGPGGEQPEGRGTVEIIPERMPVSMLEHVETPSDTTAGQRAIVDAALRFFNYASQRRRVMFPKLSVETDATTGNAIVQLFEVPQGMQGHLCLCTVDAPGSAVNPSAPLANAAIFAFLAVAPPSTGQGAPAAATIAQLRNGTVAFTPTAAAGPTLPAQWTFNDANAPVAFGGQAFYFVLVGGSQAAAKSLALAISCRINLENRE